MCNDCSSKICLKLVNWFQRYKHLKGYKNKKKQNKTKQKQTKNKQKTKQQQSKTKICFVWLYLKPVFVSSGPFCLITFTWCIIWNTPLAFSTDNVKTAYNYMTNIHISVS